MLSFAPLLKTIPLPKVLPWLFTVSPRRATESEEPALMSIPSPEKTDIPAYTPGAAVTVIDFVIVSGPYPAESSTITSPPAFV